MIFSFFFSSSVWHHGVLLPDSSVGQPAHSKLSKSNCNCNYNCNWNCECYCLSHGHCPLAVLITCGPAVFFFFLSQFVFVAVFYLSIDSHWIPGLAYVLTFGGWHLIYGLTFFCAHAHTHTHAVNVAASVRPRPRPRPKLGKGVRGYLSTLVAY